MARIPAIFLIFIGICTATDAYKKTGGSPQTANEVPSLVSWQSAIWALIALALNSIAQPSILNRAIRYSEPPFLLRSFPLICAADAIDILVRFSCYMYERRSLRDAARLVKLRCRGVWGPAAPQELQEKVTSLQRLIYIILFVLGPLPQAVKLLFGLHGVLLTKLWGWMFVVSYLLVAVVDVLAVGPERGSAESAALDQPLRSPFDKNLDFLSFRLHSVAMTLHGLVYFSCIIAFRINREQFSEDDMEHLRAILPWSASAYAIMMLAGLYFMWSNASASLWGRRTGAGVFAIGFAAYTYAATGLPDSALKFAYVLGDSLIYFIPTIGLISLACYVLTIAVINFYTGVDTFLNGRPDITEPSVSEEEQSGKKWYYDRNFVLSLNLTNLISTVLFYKFFYKSGGTSKSSWAETLG